MFIKICAFALISAVVYAVVSNMSSSLSFGVKLLATVLLCGAAVIAIEPVVRRVYELSELGGGVVEYADVVIRALGISLLAHISAEVCRDSKESSVANAVILAAKIEILILCLPLVDKIISYASDILGA